MTAFVPHMCAALWCPHLRQAHVVLIHRTQTDSFTLSASLSLPKTSLASPHLSHQSRLWSHFCLFDSSLPFFSQYIFLISLANIFFALCPIFDGLSFFSPSLFHLNTPAISVLVIHSTLKSLKHVPTGASQLCHCRMLHLPLTSHLFERVMPETSPFSRDMLLCVCVSVWI